MTRRSPEPKTPATRLHCAIYYTRRSAEEGPEQEFRSLDTQREAAEAFIQSHKREGWIALKDRYDEGGSTGANMAGEDGYVRSLRALATVVANDPIFGDYAYGGVSPAPAMACESSPATDRACA